MQLSPEYTHMHKGMLTHTPVNTFTKEIIIDIEISKHESNSYSNNKYAFV